MRENLRKKMKNKFWKKYWEEVAYLWHAQTPAPHLPAHQTRKNAKKRP